MSGPEPAPVEHPVVISTTAGPTAGVVTEPAGERRAAVILLPGAGPPGRSGVNAFWARLARRLAGIGVVSIRFDYPHYGNGAMPGAVDIERHAHEHREDVDVTVVREVAAWLRGRLDGLDLLVAGSCHGARLAVELLPHDGDVAGAFLIIPFLRDAFVPPAVREQTRSDDDVTILHDASIDALRRLALDGRPAWTLIGERDDRDAFRLRRLLGDAGDRLEIEIVPDARLHPIVSPYVQREVSGRLTERIARALHGAPSHRDAFV